MFKRLKDQVLFQGRIQDLGNGGGRTCVSGAAASGGERETARPCRLESLESLPQKIL